ncbi:MAG: FAD-dependent oxidoreductase [Thermoprotei archaeon]|jgi:NADPH-dependent 2,4-dienoyl-CoA reductase/sulfur reductase-like enzyme
MSSRKVVVIGGGAAGMSAASRARRLDPNALVTVLEQTEMVSHAPCGIPYFFEGLFKDPSLFMTYTPAYFREKRNVDVKVGAKVLSVDFSERVATYQLDGELKKLEYDSLIIATGARPKVPSVPGSTGDRVFYVHHPSEASKQAASFSSLRSVAVVGGGVLGVELSEALSSLGKKVTLIHRGPYPLSRMLDEEMGKVISSLMGGRVSLALGEALEEIAQDGRLVVTDRAKHEVDGTFVAVGVEPNVQFEGLRLGVNKTVSVDDHMMTSVKDVYAAGDVAESVNLITGRPDWQPYAPVANKMGYVAGANAVGASMSFPGVVGTAITKFNEEFIAKTGLTLTEAQRAGFRAYETTIRAKSRAHYYPGAKDIWVTLVAEEGTRRLLGGQIIGQEEVLGRIDLLALAVAKGLTAQDLFFVEMGYMPAIAGVWDPLIVAARQLMKE